MKELDQLKHWLVYSYLNKYSELENIVQNKILNNIDQIFKSMDIPKEQICFNLGANYAYNNMNFRVDLTKHIINGYQNSNKTKISNPKITTNLSKINKNNLFKNFNIIDNISLLVKGKIIKAEINQIKTSTLQNTINTENVIRSIHNIRNQIAHHLNIIKIPKNPAFSVLSNNDLAKYIKTIKENQTNIYDINIIEIEKWIDKLDDQFKLILTSEIYIVYLINILKKD